MYVIDYVEGATNPNPKVATFRVNADILTSGNITLGKVIIPKGSEILPHAPLARYLLGIGDVNRVDFTNEGADTLISVSRSVLKFEQRNKDNMKSRLKEFFKDPSRVALDLNTIAENLPTKKPLDVKSHWINAIVGEAFKDTISHQLSLHGGAMELIDVTYDENNNAITPKVYMVGSCNDCSSAGSHTLKEATKVIGIYLKKYAEDYKDNENFQALQTMSVKEILPVPISHMVFIR